MSAADVLRSFAESRSADAEVIRDGVTYGVVRAMTAELASLRAELRESERERCLVRGIVATLAEELPGFQPGMTTLDELDLIYRALKASFQAAQSGTDRWQQVEAIASVVVQAAEALEASWGTREQSPEEQELATWLSEWRVVSELALASRKGNG